MFSFIHDFPSTESIAAPRSPASILAQVQTEWAHHYVEVEVGGLTLKRLGCIYIAALRQTRLRMLEGVRSFFHLNPAH